MTIRCDFAGAGGAILGLRQAGITDGIVGVEINQDAHWTGVKAGQDRIHGDVTKVDLPATTGYTGGPPCQEFSISGTGDGRRWISELITAAREVANGRPVDAALAEHASKIGARSKLALHPLTIIVRDRPRFVILEQVPAVLPLWEACAELMRADGYSVHTEKVQAERFGVPQTRTRAKLIALRDGEVRPPIATHSRFYPRNPSRLDPDVRKWVSMAEALGRGMTERSSMTIMGGGTATGGAEPFGKGSREGMRRELEAGRWLFTTNHLRANATVRTLDQPAPTITAGHDHGERRWVQRSNFNGPNVGEDGKRLRTVRELDELSVAITGKPGHWAPAEVAQDVAESIRVTPVEAALLQTFPADHPFQGKKGSIYQQIGNAVPPLLVEVTARALLGLS